MQYQDHPADPAEYLPKHRKDGPISVDVGKGSGKCRHRGDTPCTEVPQQGSLFCAGHQHGSAT